MSLLSLRELCEQEENSYLKLERERSYVTGTSDQWDWDAHNECDNGLSCGAYFEQGSPFYGKQPRNWAGEYAFRDRDGVRHHGEIFKGKFLLHIIDGHVLLTYHKGNIIHRHERR